MSASDQTKKAEIMLAASDISSIGVPESQGVAPLTRNGVAGSHGGGEGGFVATTPAPRRGRTS